MSGVVTNLGGFLAIPLDQVHPSPNNPREHLYDIPELAASIKANGLIQPIVVTAKRVGKAASHVSNRLMLLELPLEEQEELRAGHYTLTHAQTLVRNAREAQRRREDGEARPVGRPKGAKTKPYFGDTHQLASTVRRICDHRGTPKVGGVGCGACWETAIRADAQKGKP